jgi:outer membrane lipoprotein-sorting protein
MLKSVGCVLWTIAGVIACGSAMAQDARALLMKTLRAYNSLNSYSGKATQDVDVSLANGRKQTMSAASSEMLYKRPNKFMLKISSAQASAEVYSDGSKMIVYRPMVQKYSSGPTAPTMNAMLPLLVQRANIGTVIDPLYFIGNAMLPSGLINLKTLPDAKVNGHAVSVLVGTWQVVAADKGKRVTNPFTTQGSRWTLYIDKANSLLQKVEAQIPITITQKLKRKDKAGADKIETVKLAATMVMRYGIVDAMLNPTLHESSFTFTPPPGASEQKDVNELLRGADAGPKL